MARKSRTTNSNSIVIVCEGTETEVRYLTDLKDFVVQNFPDRFSDIRIVPTAQELVVCTTRNKNKKLKDAWPWAYYVQDEYDQVEFDKYRPQPTRYVREAELFILNDGYNEAWAVYDHDNFTDHQFAKEHANQVNVNIAFSSISFEEWILLHFERNEKAFCKSVCKQKKQDIMCGTGAHDDDCHGEVCVGGHIREQKHIPLYGKNMDGLFAHLFDKHNLAIANAAWTRGLHDNPDSFWEYNPLTTVDRLIARLLDYNQEYSWIRDTDNFALDRTTLKLEEQEISNTGDNPIAFRYRTYNDLMTFISECNTGIIEPGTTMRLDIPANAKYIGFISNRDIKLTAIS